jgi:hypothetical protein
MCVIHPTRTISMPDELSKPEKDKLPEKLRLEIAPALHERKFEPQVYPCE